MQRLVLVVAIFLCQLSYAHSGGTDSYGCHNNNSTGKYECHSGANAGKVFASKEEMLATLPGSGSTTTTPDPTTIPAYNRTDYLPSWADADGDCQDTRAEVLISGSLIPVTLDSSKCIVVAGRWYDPYTNQTFTNPSDLDIDHLVPLSEAHKSGGYLWTSTQKRAYANDLINPLVLIAVDDATNQAKGDKDPANWLPPNKAYWCEYVKSWVSVKNTYGLSVDQAEQVAIDAVLSPSSSATRTGAPISWSARQSGVEAGAQFSVGLSKKTSCGYQKSAALTDDVTISAVIAPKTAHVGQVGNLYIVVKMGDSFLMQNQSGSFVPWNSKVPDLVPVKQGTTLSKSVVLEIFIGKLGIQGQLQIFLGYSATDGDLIYTPTPVQLSFTP